MLLERPDLHISINKNLVYIAGVVESRNGKNTRAKGTEMINLHKYKSLYALDDRANATTYIKRKGNT